MKKSFSLHIALLLFALFSSILSFSQEKNNHFLIAIEDSLRDRLVWENDSTWINNQLIFMKESRKIKNIHKYKLVKIGQKKFTEGPHAKIFNVKEMDSLAFHVSKYGDSIIRITGLKIYTYIGNSSWGYYYEYHLIRGNPITSLDFKISKPGFCEHGWDMKRGQACYQCLHNYKMQHDSSYRVNDSLKQLKFQSQIMDCNHGHICCEVSWCDCCPEKNPKISIEPNYKPLEIYKNVCKHEYNQNLGQACPQCRDEDRMKNDSTIKPQPLKKKWFQRKQ